MSDHITRSREPLPPHLKKWNWGAFLLNWVWGLGNNVYVALLMFIPGVNLIMPFVLGVKGNQWAWQKGNWKSEEHFLRTQRTWSRVGISVAVGFPVFIMVVFYLIMFGVQRSEPFQLSGHLMRNNAVAVAALGDPIEQNSWVISGNIAYEEDEGNADLEYEVSGPKDHGMIRFVAYLKDGSWLVEQHTLTLQSSGRVIDLLDSGN